MEGSTLEWLTKLSDVFKLPTKYVALLAFVTGAVLFSPQAILDKLHLSLIPATYGAVVGIVFLISSGIVLVNAWCEGVCIFRRRGSLARRRSQVSSELENLDPVEQAILREFMLSGSSTLKIPMDNPAVVGLSAKGILERIGAYGNYSLDGMMFPFRISAVAEKHITPDTLGLAQFTVVTDDGKLTLTHEGFEWVDERRPEFVIPRRERW
ncbi:super-infection exclusion protein B [Stieleria varia]|uniref:Uncharacterized protein n=1 Tax=Stieleria varia TaxID=2528005 RepID=A0A5C6AFU5_9BACT|nr:super-infection exclusion protein B [Stieleria varia]TWT98297.1 hypothetical protein Pla52n_48080 [Stieleria varia]